MIDLVKLHQAATHAQVEGYLLKWNGSEIRQLVDRLQSAERDTARLEFMIYQDAFVMWELRDGTIKQCQLMTQDEDENYHFLSGEHRFFNTPRAAIDAAMAATKGEQA